MDIVELLMTHACCDVTITNESNETPADAARRVGHTAIVEYLTSKHHEVNGKLTIYARFILSVFKFQLF